MSAEQSPKKNERFKIIPAVYIIFFKNSDQILLMRRHNTEYAYGNYDLPSGHNEANECPSETAVRESAEEVGLTMEKIEFRHIMLRIRRVDSVRVVMFYS